MAVRGGLVHPVFPLTCSRECAAVQPASTPDSQPHNSESRPYLSAGTEQIGAVFRFKHSARGFVCPRFAQLRSSPRDCLRGCCFKSRLHSQNAISSDLFPPPPGSCDARFAGCRLCRQNCLPKKSSAAFNGGKYRLKQPMPSQENGKETEHLANPLAGLTPTTNCAKIIPVHRRVYQTNDMLDKMVGDPNCFIQLFLLSRRFYLCTRHH